jgi:alpha-beta hydrolase superfamily lysophospholipase
MGRVRMMFGMAVALGVPFYAPESIEAQAAELHRHTVDSGGHGMAVWEKGVENPNAILLLLHGRTWSTLPDFDLQVPGEDLSLMDGLVGLGYTTYGVDLRGYGETPRDATGWNTPVGAATDLANVLRWVRGRHPDVPVHLFGWSLGSMVSQLTAQRSPDLIDRLVLYGYPIRPGSERPLDEPDGPPPRARQHG